MAENSANPGFWAQLHDGVSMVTTPAMDILGAIGFPYELQAIVVITAFTFGIVVGISSLFGMALKTKSLFSTILVFSLVFGTTMSRTLEEAHSTAAGAVLGFSIFLLFAFMLPFDRDEDKEEQA